MNASRSPSATSAAKIAFKTMPAGPSLWINLKMDSIAESKRSLYSVLGSFLIGGVGGQVLPPRELKFEPAAVRLRRKSSDLIHKCKIFGTRRKEHVSAQPALTSRCQRKSQPRCSGGPPLRSSARKTAPRTQQTERPCPIPWQVKCCCTVQRQDARRRKPVPMFLQRRFGAPQKPGFANSPASVVAIEGFGLRNNSHIVR